MKIQDAYSTKELCGLLCVVPSSITRLAKREGWQSRPRQGRGGGHEWLVASMPGETRASIAAAVAEAVMNLPVPAGLAGMGGAGQLAPGRALPVDVVVPDWSWNKAKARHLVLTRWREHCARAKKRGVFVKEATAEFLTLLASGLAVPRDAAELVASVNMATLYRWDKLLKEAGGDFEALADKRGGWLNGRAKGLGQIGEEAEKAFLAVYLRRNQPSRMFGYNCMKAYLESRDTPAPSYASVCRFFERFDSRHHDVGVWMREGEKAYSDEVGKYISRDDRLLNVGDVLVADGHKMNFMVIKPTTGKPCRMTLIGWQDWASRMFVGFDIMESENTQAISASFFNAIMHLGKLPGSVYLDNGKAFKNRFFDGDSTIDLDEFNGLYARLGVKVTHSLPYVARTKIIERWWRDFDQQCAVALPSYVGRDIKHKPAHMRRGENWARARQTKEEYYPTVAEVGEMLVKFAIWKARQPHPTRPGETPWSVFMAGRGPGFAPDELQKLSRQFLYREPVHPKRCRFTLRTIEFEADQLHNLNTQLTAYYSHSDLSQVYIYEREHFICVARPVASHHPMARLFGDDLDLQRVTEAQRKQAQLKNRTRRLATDLAEHGLPEAAEIMQALPFNLSRQERRTPLDIRGEIQALEASLAPAPLAPLTPELTAELTEEERAELADLEARIKADEAWSAPYDVPFFPSERERYEYFFVLNVQEGQELLPEHEAWMREYEQSPAYAPSAERYEKLRAMFAEFTNKRKAI